jgi:hypothetical protein
MMTHVPVWIAATAIALCAAGPAAAQEELDVSGVVVNASTGAPVADAGVAIGRRGTVTDDAGRFHVCRVADGLLTVAALRYRPDTSAILPAPGPTAEVRVALQPDTARLSILHRNPKRISPDAPDALYIVNGRRVFILRTGCETPPPGLPAIDAPLPDEIEAVYVLGRREGEEQFGSDGEHGVVYITLRQGTTP